MKASLLTDAKRTRIWEVAKHLAAIPTTKALAEELGLSYDYTSTLVRKAVRKIRSEKTQ